VCPTPSPAPVSMQQLVESLCECRLEFRLVRWVEGSEVEGSEVEGSAVEGSEVRPTQSSACLFSLSACLFSLSACLFSLSACLFSLIVLATSVTDECIQLLVRLVERAAVRVM
jgi:hypothetical protein